MGHSSLHEHRSSSTDPSAIQQRQGVNAMSTSPRSLDAIHMAHHPRSSSQHPWWRTLSDSHLCWSTRSEGKRQAFRSDPETWITGSCGTLLDKSSKLSTKSLDTYQQLQQQWHCQTTLLQHLVLATRPYTSPTTPLQALPLEQFIWRAML